MGNSNCDICNEKFTYKRKLTAEWVSNMEISCCGRSYVPTGPSRVLSEGLLLGSIISAFWFDIMPYLAITVAWAITLSLITPLILRYKPKRIYGAADRFGVRVLAKMTWGGMISFLVVVSGADIIGFRKHRYAISLSSDILISLAALAAVALVALAAAIVRVLWENRKPRRSS